MTDLATDATPAPAMAPLFPDDAPEATPEATPPESAAPGVAADEHTRERDASARIERPARVAVDGRPGPGGALAPSANTPPDGLAPLVALLASSRHDPATIRELLDIQREHDAERAREAYAEALARFRAVAPTLAKDRVVAFAARERGRGATSYRHTSLGYAMATVNPLLGALGLNLSWHPRVLDGIIHVETRLTHRLGHSESVTLPGAPDQSGNKNAIQAMKSTITYLERAGAFALLGLASSDDDDGRGASVAAEPSAFMSFDQAAELADLLERIERHDAGYRRRFLEHYGGAYAPGDNALGLDIPREKFDKARSMLRRKLADVRAGDALAAGPAAGTAARPVTEAAANAAPGTAGGAAGAAA